MEVAVLHAHAIQAQEGVGGGGGGGRGWDEDKWKDKLIGTSKKWLKFELYSPHVYEKCLVCSLHDIMEETLSFTEGGLVEILIASLACWFSTLSREISSRYLVCFFSVSSDPNTWLNLLCFVVSPFERVRTCVSLQKLSALIKVSIILSTETSALSHKSSELVL